MPKFIHYGSVTSDGKIIYDYPSIYYKTVMELRGKRIKCIFEENIDRKTLSQLDYYVGIVIKKYCLEDEQFGGHSYDDIIDYFLDRVFGHEKEYRIQGVTSIKRTYPTLSKLNVKEMSMLIEKTIMILSFEFSIIVEDADRYKGR